MAYHFCHHTCRGGDNANLTDIGRHKRDHYRLSDFTGSCNFPRSGRSDRLWRGETDSHREVVVIRGLIVRFPIAVAVVILTLFIAILPLRLASAVPLDIQLTFDLNTGTFEPNPNPDVSPGVFTVSTSLGSPVDLLQSDNIININVNFLPGQSLRLFDFTGSNTGTGGFSEFVQIKLGSSCACSTGGNGLMEFKGVSGDLLVNPANAFTNTSNGFTISSDWLSVDLTSTFFDFSGLKLENYNYSLNFVNSFQITEATIRFFSNMVEIVQTPQPVADAGPDQTVDEDEPVTLNGSQSIGDGDPLTSYEWSQLSGPTVVLDLTNPQHPTFTAPIVGSNTTLTFQLVVGDGIDFSDPDMVDISVASVLPPSTARANLVGYGGGASPRGFYEINSLDGSATFTFGVSSAFPVLSTGGLAMLGDKLYATNYIIGEGDVFYGTVDFSTGAFVFTPIGLQGSGNWNGLTANQSTGVLYAVPLIDGILTEIVPGSSITKIGTGTGVSGSVRGMAYDDFGGILYASVRQPSDIALLYTIDITTGIATLVGEIEGLLQDVALTFDESNGKLYGYANATPTGFDRGLYEINVNTAEATLIGFNGVPIGSLTWMPAPPVADAGPDQTVDEGELVSLDGSLSTGDGDPLTSYEWSQPGGPLVTLDLSDPQHPTFTAPFVAANTTLTFELVVGDGTNFSDPDTVDIVVANVIIPPIADAGDDQTVEETSPAGADVVLDGSGSNDPDGGSLTYEWIGPFGTATGSTPTVSIPLGVHIITLTVTDEDDADATDLVIITVLEAPNVPPIANAGEDFTVDFKKRKSTAVQFDGSGSVDPDSPTGQVASYEWVIAGELVGTGAMPIVELEVGVFTATLTVTDDDGAQDTDDVIVTVTKNGSGDDNPGGTINLATRRVPSVLEAIEKGRQLCEHYRRWRSCLWI